MLDLTKKSTEYLQGALAGFRKSATEESDLEHIRHQEDCPLCRAHAISIELATRFMREAADVIEAQMAESDKDVAAGRTMSLEEFGRSLDLTD